MRMTRRQAVMHEAACKALNECRREHGLPELPRDQIWGMGVVEMSRECRRIRREHKMVSLYTQDVTDGPGQAQGRG